MKKNRHREENVAVTVVLIVIIAALFVVEFLLISNSLRQRAIGRMEEGVQTVINEVTAKLERDSRILNATADIISSADNFDREATMEIMEQVTPLLETMTVRVLLPDDTVLTPGGGVTDVSDDDSLSFAAEAPLGEHVSDRMYTVNGHTPVLRHFVPIIQDGETAALLYGITRLDELPDALNVDNLYNASASVYIIDTRTGDFLLDTYPTHTELGNIRDFDTSDREVQGDKDWSEYSDDLMNLGTGYVVYRTKNTTGWDYMSTLRWASTSGPSTSLCRSGRPLPTCMLRGTCARSSACSWR